MTQLQVEALTCLRGEQFLWENLSFQVGAGQLLQIIGANGSGKTSLLKILAGLAKAHRGSVRWQGQCIQKQKLSYQQQIFYLSHQHAVKNALTVSENLYLSLTRIFHPQQLLSALQQVGLTAYRDHFGYQLSQGQKQRLALAKALLSDAPVWILDEPLTALDQEMLERVSTIFESQLQRRGIIILTTHRPLIRTDLVSDTLVLNE